MLINKIQTETETKANYIKRSKLDWPNLWNDLGMSKDKGGRWYPGDDTPDWVAEYLSDYRSPSRAWPNSYATALLTCKFAKLLTEKEPSLAIELGVAEKI